MFTEKFDSHVAENDSIETTVGCFTAVARVIKEIDFTVDDDNRFNFDLDVLGVDEETRLADILEARELRAGGEWFYGIVDVTVYKKGIALAGSNLGAIAVNCPSFLGAYPDDFPESNSDYLNQVANELLPVAIENAKKVLADLCSD